MFRKSIFILSLVAVLSAVGTSSAELVAWWRFDGGSGTTAIDSSGNGNDGTLTGGATWTDGQLGGAIQFNGSNSYVAAPHIPLDSRSFSIAMWINPVLYTNEQVIFAQHQSGSTNLSIHFRLGGPNIGSGNVPARGVRMGFYSNDLDTSGELIEDNTWYHLTFWYDFENQTRRIYVNGVQQAEDAGNPYLGTSGETRIGQWNNNQWFQGIIDDVQIYNHPLTDDEIQASMRGIKGIPKAAGANPEDGALLEQTWATMTWRAGDFAVSHDVYFSDNFDDVNSGAEAAFQGNKVRTDTMLLAGFFGYPYPDGLVPGTTYYWRVDEVNDADPNSPWIGDVWSFTVPSRTAYDPIPADNARYVFHDVALSWTPGLNAKLHTVYFGDDCDTVANATDGQAQGATTFDPGPLEGDKIYYWRVDELDPPTTHKSDVWSFRTIPDMPINDPNLVGWWKFDEGFGIDAFDWSGYGNHAVLQGGPQWVTGQIGGALEFDGSDSYVAAPHIPLDSRSFTIALWINPVLYTDQQVFFAQHETGSQNLSMHFRLGGPDGTAPVPGAARMGFYSNDLDTPGGLIQDNTWYHLTFWYDFENQTRRIYVDGIQQAEDNGDLYLGASGETRIGQWNNSQWFMGMIDDVRIYNKALTPDEIANAMIGDPDLASGPSPANGSISDVLHAATLTWSAGDRASEHAVYFGTDMDAVAVADTSDTTGVFRVQQTDTSYTPPGGVMPGQSYYWRVDEHNTDGTVTKGHVWNFVVADYIIVDDFESYDDDSNLVYERYQDGFENPNVNGSTIGYVIGESMEKVKVRSGDQSVPFIFDNTTALVSEVLLNFTPAQDWTIEGVITLSLWFAGDGANVPGQFYIKVNGVQVNYDGDASNLTRGAWQAWNVDLTAIVTNMSNVTSLALGIQGSGATGTLLLDDIRLYAKPREFITPVQPSNAGLVSYYSFDGNTNDSVGANHGSPSGGPLYFAGKVGQAISLDGIDDFVSTGKFASELGIEGNNPRTITVWVYTRDFLNGGLYDVGNRTTAQDFCLRTYNDEENRWRVQYWGGDFDFTYPTREKWVHFTHVHDGTHTKIYADGLLVVDWEKTIDTTDDNPFQIGCYGWQVDYFNGMIDELRLYNRALTSEEAAGAAGITQPYHKPLED